MITKHFKRLGVSLVELVGVVAVIGVLAAITLPRVGRVMEDARQRRNDGNARELMQAIQRATTLNVPLTDYSTVESIASQLEARNLVTSTASVTSSRITVYPTPEGDVLLIGTFD